MDAAIALVIILFDNCIMKFHLSRTRQIRQTKPSLVEQHAASPVPDGSNRAGHNTGREIQFYILSLIITLFHNLT